MENDTEFVFNEKVMDLFLTITGRDNSKEANQLHQTLINIFPKRDTPTNSSVYLVNVKLLNRLSNYAKENKQTKVAKALWKLPTVKFDDEGKAYY